MEDVRGWRAVGVAARLGMLALLMVLVGMGGVALVWVVVMGSLTGPSPREERIRAPGAEYAVVHEKGAAMIDPIDVIWVERGWLPWDGPWLVGCFWAENEGPDLTSLRWDGPDRIVIDVTSYLAGTDDDGLPAPAGTFVVDVADDGRPERIVATSPPGIPAPTCGDLYELEVPLVTGS